MKINGLDGILEKFLKHCMQFSTWFKISFVEKHAIICQKHGTLLALRKILTSILQFFFQSALRGALTKNFMQLINK